MKWRLGRIDGRGGWLGAGETGKEGGGGKVGGTGESFDIVCAALKLLGHSS